MDRIEKKPITIIGAGLAGCFLSILLAKRGYQVTLYERTSKKNIFKKASKRSFNLTFYGYGVQALKEAGLWKAVKPIVLTLNGSITQVGNNADAIITKLDKKKMPYYTVSRSRLLQTLVEQALQHPGITINFDTSLIAINRLQKTITVKHTKTHEQSTINANVVLGTDGVNSQVRKFMQRGQKAIHSHEFANWNYKQIPLSKELAKKLSLQNNYMHAWTRKEALFTAFPNGDGSFAAMLILPKNETHGFSTLTDDATIKEFITKHFPELSLAIPAISKAVQRNPESHFITMSTSHWYYKNFIAILGDAAHAFLPFYGQGISTAFADCIKLAELMDKHGNDWGRIFPIYQRARKKHTDVLGNLSKESFIRYTRTKKADYSAIYDKLEFMAHQIISRIQPPLYVSVSKDPAHAADHLKRYKRQRKFAKSIGVPILVHAITQFVAFQENSS